MRLRALFAVAVVVPALTVLAACGSSGPNGGDGGSAESQPSDSSQVSDSGVPSSTGSAAPTPLGPNIPADTEIAPAVDRAQMPQASGSFGDKPTITMPSTPPPDSLQRVILSAGDGPVLKSGEQVLVNYLGQVWGGDVFDNSYDRGAPMLARIGTDEMVPGWDVGLPGVTEGSRVLLSFPPRDGYGIAGRAPKISGTDTLVFVVDVVRVVSDDLGGDPNAVVQSTPAGLPEVSGALGSKPAVTVPQGLAEPTQASVTVLAKGSGAPVQAGSVLVQYSLVTWDNTHTETSWPSGDSGADPSAEASTEPSADPSAAPPATQIGPQSVPISPMSPLGGLLGVPVGSRVLLITPADSNAGAPSLAWVIDVIMQQSITPATGS